MSLNDELLNQGPREAPEPETAEQRSHRMGMKTVGGGIAAGGAALAKLGVAGKLVGWFFAFHLLAGGFVAGWIGLVVLLALSFGAYYLRHRDDT
jgi:hypothetical protein